MDGLKAVPFKDCLVLQLQSFVLFGNGGRFELRGVVGGCMSLLHTVSSTGAHVVLLQVLSYQLDGDRAPACAGVRLGVVAERVKVRQVLLDKCESLLFVAPIAGEIGLATGRLAHALK